MCGSRPLPERWSGHRQDHWMQFPCVWRVATWSSCFSITAFDKCLPSSWEPQCPHSGSPPIFLFPVLMSLYFSSLCPLLLLSCPPERKDIMQLQHRSFQLVRLWFLWWAVVTLKADKQRWERLTRQQGDSGPLGFSWRQSYESDRNLTLCHVMARSPIIPILPSFFPCYLLLSFSLFSPLFPLPLPWSLYLHSHSIYPENFLFVSLSCHWNLCFV